MTEKHKNKDTPLDIGFAAELARGLSEFGALERGVGIFVELRGIAGEHPKSLRAVDRGLSAERIRQIVHEIESRYLREFVVKPEADSLRADVGDALKVIATLTPGSDESIHDALKIKGINIKSPASVVRLADILGCNNVVRLTLWTSRSKFKHDAPGELAAPEDDPHLVSVTAIVPNEMPEVFESFMNFARRVSRGAGVVSAGALADKYSQGRGVAIAQAEAVAFLSPFAVHLGRHNGDDWFAFFNSANDFLRKAATRVSLFGQCSFELLNDFHRRFNRSLYADGESQAPEAALRAAISLSGYRIEGDVVTTGNTGSTLAAGRGASDTQKLMVKIFNDTIAKIGGRKTIPRAQLVAAMKAAGIRESTAHIYLGNQGLFICKKGSCRLANVATELANEPVAADKSISQTPPKPGIFGGNTLSCA